MNIENEVPQEADHFEGRYANYFKIGYNAFEFLLDCGQHYNEGGMAQLHTRIITSPIYAKTLLDLLQDSIDLYEQAFGPIRDADGGENNRTK